MKGVYQSQAYFLFIIIIEFSIVRQGSLIFISSVVGAVCAISNQPPHPSASAGRFEIVRRREGPPLEIAF